MANSALRNSTLAWSDASVHVRINAALYGFYGGAFNTRVMLESLGVGSPVALACANFGRYSGGWYLPTESAMIAMYSALGPDGTNDVVLD